MMCDRAELLLVLKAFHIKPLITPWHEIFTGIENNSSHNARLRVFHLGRSDLKMKIHHLLKLENLWD